MTENTSQPPNPRRPASLVLLLVVLAVAYFMLRGRRSEPADMADLERPPISPTVEIEQKGGSVSRDEFNRTVVTLPAASDADFASLARLQNVASLNLRGSAVTDASLAQLQALDGLEVLNLADTRISNAGLEHLRHLKGLRHLNVAQTQVTGAGLVHLSALPELRVLLLGETSIDDDSLSHLSGLTRLNLLFLTGPPTPSNKGLASYGQITDVGLEKLSGLEQLKILDVRYNQVTEAGVEELKTALPACDVRF